jgi:hypothetical protein
VAQLPLQARQLLLLRRLLTSLPRFLLPLLLLLLLRSLLLLLVLLLLLLLRCLLLLFCFLLLPFQAGVTVATTATQPCFAGGAAGHAGDPALSPAATQRQQVKQEHSVRGGQLQQADRRVRLPSAVRLPLSIQAHD